MTEALGQYSASEEFEVFAHWFQELWRHDKEFAEQFVLALIPEADSATQLDKTD